ncbi:hypothetical protein D3C81_937480 [compost metagenome]
MFFAEDGAYAGGQIGVLDRTGRVCQIDFVDFKLLGDRSQIFIIGGRLNVCIQVTA